MSVHETVEKSYLDVEESKKCLTDAWWWSKQDKALNRDTSTHVQYNTQWFILGEYSSPLIASTLTALHLTVHGAPSEFSMLEKN